MGLTVNLTQLKRKKRKDGTIPIYVRITEDRKSRYLSTGVSILPKYWNSNKQIIRRSHPRRDKLNQKLRRVKRKVNKKRDTLEQKGKLNVKSLKNQVKKDGYTTLLSCAERYHDSLEGTERFHEWKKVGVLINNLRDFLGNKNIDVSKVDAKLIEDFQDFLLTRVNYDEKKEEYYGNNPNTVRRKLTSLKGLFIRLQKSKSIKHDPFLQVEKVSKKPVQKTRLTFSQINDIQQLDLKKGSHLWHTRNYFLYSFYNAGIRFGDLCQLQWKNIIDGRLQYTMEKTGGYKSIKQAGPMNDILDLYRRDNQEPGDLIFPILDRPYSNPATLRRKIGSQNALVNKRLKKIATQAGIDSNISFHVSRHSFSHYALTKGTPLYSISKALGHADLKTTQEYLESFDEELLDKSMDKLF